VFIRGFVATVGRLEMGLCAYSVPNSHVCAASVPHENSIASIFSTAPFCMSGSTWE
jgi:hypothetical protein